jgi:hypothetical protein
VRQVSDLEHLVSVAGIHGSPVHEADALRAGRLAINLLALMDRPGMRRAKLAVRTFLIALSEQNLGQRIHQFVRAVDGLVNSRGRHEFKERCRVLVGDASAEVCRELYVIRNNAEHFNDPDNGLDQLPTRRDSALRGWRRTHEAEALARYCMARLVEDARLWPHFSDDQVAAFWAKPHDECRRIWGEQLDLDAAVATFDPDYVGDDGEE